MQYTIERVETAILIKGFLMQKIVECVPNVSEGQDKEIISQITDKIKQTQSVKLLNIDSGKDTNRTVITFIGTPESVLEAAFAGIRESAMLIDMRKHHGTHPRIGAVDVCPFIPVRGVSIPECVELVKKLAKRVGEELSIPVYLYGHTALKPERVKLSFIRKGGYESLTEKMRDINFKPDFGPSKVNVKFGALVTGVRDFMLAYNINLDTKDKNAACKIAGKIRESGRIIMDDMGNPVRIPGKLKYCQASGWYIEEYGYAQVTMNLHNYRVTGLHTVFEAVCEEAEKLNIKVTGSELIGMTPLKALLDAGRYYLGKKSAGEGALIRCAVNSLGLSRTSEFKPQERILDYFLYS